MTFPLALGAAARVAQSLLPAPLAALSQPKSSLLDRVALNPQPLPPRDVAAGQSLAQRLGMYFDEFCGTMPRRLPPPPPPPLGGLF